MNRLTKSPDGMALMDGSKKFRWRGTLTWSLYGRSLYHGLANAMSVVDDRKSVGANTVCTSITLPWGFPVTFDHPQVWNGLTPFVRGCADRSMRVCLTVFTGTALPEMNMQGTAKQLATWERVYTHLAGEPNVTLVLANQADHREQDIDLSAFRPPKSVGGFPALLACIDNPLEDAMPTQPFWDFSAFDASRQEPKWWAEAGAFSMASAVLIGANGQEPSRRATVMFEPPPCGRPGQPDFDSPAKWRMHARSLCMDGTIGGNFYSDFDARSEIYPSGSVRNAAVEYLGNIPEA